MINRRPILLFAWVGVVTLASALSAHATDNTLLGTGAGDSLTPDAHRNTLLGYNAGNAITDPYSNTLVGSQAGESTTFSENTMVGTQAGWKTTTGCCNAIFGYSAGLSMTGGSSANTYLGRSAGSANQTGFGNVFVGHYAGANELGSYKLYIDNFPTAAPLIYGEFLNDVVGINGALGVGTQIPLDQLHVRDGNLRIEQTGPTHALLNFISNGKTWEIKNNEATGRLTFFSAGGGATTASFKFDRQATENLLRVGVLAADTVDITGNLVVTGLLINPDYVFTSEYALESIEDHAAYMWEHRHLPAVGPGQVNAQGQAMVNVGLRSQGMLEELEKAHIYIEQLYREMIQTEVELAALQTDGAHNGKQIAALTKEMTTLKATEADLAVLESQLAEKEAQMDRLQDKIAALKALVRQLRSQNPDPIPGKES